MIIARGSPKNVPCIITTLKRQKTSRIDTAATKKTTTPEKALAPSETSHAAGRITRLKSDRVANTFDISARKIYVAKN